MFADDVKFSPWWWQAVPRRTACEAGLPSETDVVIIGAGFTGLSAALTLARAGREIVVLDEQDAGFGASTRNGGQVGPGNQKFSVAELTQRFGQQKAKALMLEGNTMLEYIKSLIERENIECHFKQVGRFRGAWRPNHYDNMAQTLESVQRFIGTEFFMVPKPEQHTEIGSDFYHGGSVLPNDASLHPGLYHQGLFNCAQQAGATILPFTPALNIESSSSSLSVITAKGTIKTGDCIVATNGYTSRALRWHHLRIVPVGSAIIATEKIEPQLMTELMPKQRVMGDSRRVFNYYRPSPDGKRILMGGRYSYGNQNNTLCFTHLYEDLQRLFPQLKGTKITHCWSGKVGYTFDGHPHLGKHEGVHYAMGYCGTGVSRSTYFGHKVALKVLNDPEGMTPFDDIEFKSHTFYSGSPWMVPLAESWERFRDVTNL